MTWFASEILAPATPGLVREMLEFPAYRDAVYVVRSLSEYPFHREDVRHGVPGDGLLVVQPVGEPAVLGDWFEEPVIPWLPPPAWPKLQLEHPPHSVASLLGDKADCLPPEAFLASLKGLSRKHGAPLAYGYFSTWGGMNQLEYAWVFGERESLLLNAGDADEHLLLRDGQPPRARSGGLLEQICEALGFTLPSGFFAPHTRRFPWDHHRASRTSPG